VIEPILTLAISVHSNPGVYALLLGSGLSRPAGIPTGWDVVLDLVRKVALLAGEDCEPGPASWYQSKYGEEPDYSKLLDQLAKSPPERQQLLRSYFEPDEDEREQGLKLPTVAHRAIAELVTKGYVRVIVTTNFDRLMEQALEAVGVTPTVISSADQVSGALPLAHTSCTVIKVHGDYVDTRIKNTPDELAVYDPLMDGLLDRVFDEYGLIVCGWSAQWDPALRAAIERAPNRRFTTFWAARGKVTGEAAGLLQQRRAEPIQIESADSFFQDLTEKVLSLEQISLRHPLSTHVAVATLKRYLPDTRQRIRARDLLMEEANRLHESLNVPRFQVEGHGVSYKRPEVATRVKAYEALTSSLCGMIATGCYWGDESHEDFWRQCLERIADHGGSAGGYTVLINLRLYPALLLMYAGGIAATAAMKYGNLAALLVRSTAREMRHLNIRPAALALDPEEVFEPEQAWHMLGRERRPHTPVSDYLHLTLRETLRDLLPRDAEYTQCFDRFEVLLALIAGDLNKRITHYFLYPVGSFIWRDMRTDDTKRGVISNLYSEIESAGEEWPGFKAGLFDGKIEQFQAIKSEFDEELKNERSQKRIRY
jgi:hypothetical protein